MPCLTHRCPIRNPVGRFNPNFSYLCDMPEILETHSLTDLNSFHLDVRAKRYCECKTVNEIEEVINAGVLKAGKALILGEGSNILFTGDYNGFVLHPLILGREIIRENRDHVWIKSGAGENWDEFVAWSVNWGFGGLENLSLIPGSVGSSPIQNVGAYGAEVEQFIEEVSALDLLTGQKLSFSREACRFDYRDSIFKREWKGKCVITSVTFRLDKKPRLNLGYPLVAEKMAGMERQDVQAVREVIMGIRRSKLPDPEVLGNAGSFFKNPVMKESAYRSLLEGHPGMPSYPAGGSSRKIPAAWLIEKCGWKGKRIGDAGSYEKQPLVLVNHGSATGKDILMLAEKIETDVRDRFGIKLDREVNVF